MKDPLDKQTLDFANLVTEFEQEHGLEPGSVDVPKAGVSFSELTLLLDHVRDGLKRPVGRPPKGDKAMSKAEKQKAYRDRQRAARDAERARLTAIKAGEPVTSLLIDLESSFADLLREKNQSNRDA